MWIDGTGPGMVMHNCCFENCSMAQRACSRQQGKHISGNEPSLDALHWSSWGLRSSIGAVGAGRALRGCASG